MAIIHNAKGLIITGGLGGAACCSLITSPFFSLVCKCDLRIDVIGGGGYYPYHVVTPYYTPYRAPSLDTCLVLIDIKLADHHWRKSYVVDKGRGDTIITLINTFNKVKGKIVEAVTSFKRSVKKTFVYFTRRDK